MIISRVRIGRILVPALLGLAFGTREPLPAWGQIRTPGQVLRPVLPANEEPSDDQEPEAPQPEAPPAPMEAGEPVPADQLLEIQAARTAEELFDLAKTFFITRQIPAAAMCVERACNLKKELLTDTSRQSPRSWHEFWFSQRAKMRERRLPTKDVAARVELAVWLYEAGLSGPARNTLSAALQIDKNDAQARALAEKWHLFSGGPVQFNLTCGLTQPLLVSSIQDEGLTLTPRKDDHQYLILPIAYATNGMRLLISKTDVKVTTDEGKRCTSLGIALLESQSPGPSGRIAARQTATEIKLNTGSDPLWEQLQILPPEEGQQLTLAAYNRLHPIILPKPGAPRDHQPARPSGPLGKQDRPPSGHAAFVFEVPTAFKSVECTYKGDAPLKLEAEFLRELSTPVGGAGTEDPVQLAGYMAVQTRSSEAVVAAAAARKLGQIRSSARQIGTDPAQGNPLAAGIGIALFQALGHADGHVRQISFDTLIEGTEPPDQRVLDAVRQEKNADLLLNLLKEIRAYFVDLQEDQKTEEMAREESQLAGSPFIAPQLPAAPAGAAPGVPVSPAPPSVFALLGTCLNSALPEARQQAVDLILTEPCEQGLALLGSASREAVELVLQRASRSEDAALKSAMLRLLLNQADPELIGKILATFEGVRVIVKGDDDPVLALAMKERQSPAVRRQILELLATADLTAVETTTSFTQFTASLCSPDVQSDAAVCAAILKLALTQFKPPYQAPVRPPGYHARQPAAEGGFENVLASLIVNPVASRDVAREAAVALLQTGRLDALNDQLDKAAGNMRVHPRVHDLIVYLAREKRLWTREATPIFLAGRLSSPDERTLQLALGAIAEMRKGLDPKQRWRLNLAIKQALTTQQMIKLTGHEKENISGAATVLLAELAGFTPSETNEYRGLPDENSRQDHIRRVDENRKANAVGPFACMVYLDVQPARTAPPQVRAGESAPAAPPAPRSRVPLAAPPLRIQRSGQQVRVLLDGTQIGPPPSPNPSSDNPGVLRIDAGPLLRAALASPEAAAEGLADRVELSALRTEILCELRYDQFGMYSGEAGVSDTGGATESPLRPAAAKIVMDPLTQ
jgi:hypothetical protein